MSRNLLQEFDRPLRVELKASRLLFSVNLGLSLLIALSWLQLAMSVPAAMLLSGILVWHLVYLHRLHVSLRAGDAIQAISWDRARGWRIRTAGQSWQDATLCQPFFLSYRLAAARFETGTRRRHAAILVPDRLNSADFRRLRVRLLQSRQPAARTRDAAQKP